MAYDLTWVIESIPILIGKNVPPGDTTDSQNNCPISKNAITRMKRFVKFK